MGRLPQQARVQGGSFLRFLSILFRVTVEGASQLSDRVEDASEHPDHDQMNSNKNVEISKMNIKGSKIKIRQTWVSYLLCKCQVLSRFVVRDTNVSPSQPA